jgi:hypothetical protein
VFVSASSELMKDVASRQKIFSMGEDPNGLLIRMKTPQNRKINPQTLYLGPGSIQFRQFQVDFEKVLDSNRILARLSEKDNRSSKCIAQEGAYSKRSVSIDSKARRGVNLSSISKSSSVVENFKEKSSRILSPVEQGVIKVGSDQKVQTRQKSRFYRKSPVDVSNPLEAENCQQNPDDLFESQSTPDEDSMQ